MYNTSLGCASERDIKVRQSDMQPLDSVQTICWDKNEGNNRFLVGGWDGVLRMYEIKFQPQYLEQVFFMFLDEPIISCTMDRNYLAFTGHSDGTINAINIPTNQKVQIGKHDAAIRDVYWVEQIGALVSLGFDNKINFWKMDSIMIPVHTVTLPAKTTATAFDFPYLLIGSSEDKFCIVKVDNPINILTPKYYDCQLGAHSKILSADLNANAKSWLMGSTDGRANFGFFNDLGGSVDCSNSIVCFKAQKKDEYLKSWYHQTNTVGFYSRKADAVWVGGGENNLTFYTAQKQGDRIKQYRYKCPITTSKLSPNGSFLAYALGVDWVNGLTTLNKHEPKVFVHMILEEDYIKR